MGARKTAGRTLLLPRAPVPVHASQLPPVVRACSARLRTPTLCPFPSLQGPDLWELRYPLAPQQPLAGWPPGWVGGRGWEVCRVLEKALGVQATVCRALR